MSFEIDALFEGNFLIALIISFLETGLKEKLLFPKCSFIIPQLSSFLNDWVLSSCRSLRPLVTLVKWVLKILQIFSSSLIVWKFSVRIMITVFSFICEKKFFFPKTLVFSYIFNIEVTKMTCFGFCQKIWTIIRCCM